MQAREGRDGVADAFCRFSGRDDRSDSNFFTSVNNLLEDDLPHASAVILPGLGRIFARAVMPDGKFIPVGVVSVVGDDLDFWFADNGDFALPEFVRRHAQAFGSGTVQLLRRLRIAVIGCSGTGSPVIEQLVRLGIGRLVLVDMDRVEWKNRNRIYLTTAADANLARYKVEVLAEPIGRIGLATQVIPLDGLSGTRGCGVRCRVRRHGHRVRARPAQPIDDFLRPAVHRYGHPNPPAARRRR
jgi:hypothetical protein